MPTDILECIWSPESIGISQNPDDNDKSDYFREYQQPSIEFKNGNYTANFPWTLEHPPLPSNYDISKKRKDSMIKRLQRDPHLLKNEMKLLPNRNAEDS